MLKEDEFNNLLKTIQDNGYNLRIYCRELFNEEMWTMLNKYRPDIYNLIVKYDKMENIIIEGGVVNDLF